MLPFGVLIAPYNFFLWNFVKALAFAHLAYEARSSNDEYGPYNLQLRPQETTVTPMTFRWTWSSPRREPPFRRQNL